jgi:hypothetical protein
LAPRPEKIEIVRAGSTLPNQLAGTVANWSYAGAASHVLVDTADAGQMALTVPAWRLGTQPEIGAAITIGWDPDASIRPRTTRRAR